jgi:FkbM family methyltransferase
MLTTKSKIKIAAALSHIVRTARTAVGSTSDNVLVKRDGIAWRLDLKEGIDFGIFLGLYERSTTRAIRQWVRPGNIVLDVGANIGTHTLELARRVGPGGKVFAFEPTVFAHSKLLQNLALNPSLAAIVKPEQLMLAASDDRAAELQIYSSWPLIRVDSLHANHLGRLQSTEGSRAICLDTYLRQAGVAGVDFIKLDVDGFECEVLEGARHCLDVFRPTILLELAPYVLRERGASLTQLVGILGRSGYCFARLDGEGFDPPTLESKIADGSSINVIARVGPISPGLQPVPRLRRSILLHFLKEKFDPFDSYLDFQGFRRFS